MPMNEIIREKRKSLGLTQEQVAERLGVSAPAVNKWEKGATYPLSLIHIYPTVPRAPSARHSPKSSRPSFRLLGKRGQHMDFCAPAYATRRGDHPLNTVKTLSPFWEIVNKNQRVETIFS